MTTPKQAAAELMMPHPKDTPLNKWPAGWLKMEVASLLDTPGYIMTHDHEKRAAGHPVTQDEMRDFIRAARTMARQVSPAVTILKDAGFTVAETHDDGTVVMDMPPEWLEHSND